MPNTPNQIGVMRRRIACCFLLAALMFISLYVLGVRTLVPPDEGRYAEMAREMFASGDWLTTRLNGIKYFEKPPLQTWMTALAFNLFGVGAWQARLWTGLCGIVGVLLAGYTGMRVFHPRVGLYASLVLGSSFYWIACSQINSLDMGLSGMMTLSLCTLLLAQRDAALPSQRRDWMLVCWAGMALAVLSKGLVGVILPGGVLVFYTLAARDWSIWTRLHAVKGLLLFFAIAAPWFVLVGLANPEQPHFFFIHEHFDRFLLKEHHREAAWWIFPALVAAGSVPWLGVLGQSLGQSLVQAVRPAPDAPRERFQPALLLLVWLVFITAFFMQSSSKLPGYILPVFPAVALLVAVYLHRASRRSRSVNAGLTVLLGAILVGIVPFMPGLAKRAGEAALYQQYQPWVLSAGIVALLGAVVALLYERKQQAQAAVLVLALAGFGSTHLLLAGFEPVGQARAGTRLLPAIQAELTPAGHIYSVGIYEQSLTFYLGRPVILVDYLDEFAFGLEQQPQLAIPTVDAFIVQWRAHAAAGVKDVAITRHDIAQQLQRDGVPVRIVASDARRIVIANL
jgi:4-amino-4-deoxy-L-arabinose transferase-like glycosyltransferase